MLHLLICSSKEIAALVMVKFCPRGLIAVPVVPCMGMDPRVALLFSCFNREVDWYCSLLTSSL
jgi:hypothetical protein